MKKPYCKIPYYRWGEYKGITGPFSQKELDLLMELNGNHILGFNIREEDQDKTFYAHPSDVDVNEEGTSVSYCIAIKQETKLNTYLILEDDSSNTLITPELLYNQPHLGINHTIIKCFKAAPEDADKVYQEFLNERASRPYNRLREVANCLDDIQYLLNAKPDYKPQADSLYQSRCDLQDVINDLAGLDQ